MLKINSQISMMENFGEYATINNIPEEHRKLAKAARNREKNKAKTKTIRKPGNLKKYSRNR
jgi:hypothetical protein